MFQKHSYRLNTSIAKILPVILLPLSIAGCYQDMLVAGGPGTGGTGPIIVTSSDEFLSSGKHSNQSLKGTAPPTAKVEVVIADEGTGGLPKPEKSKDTDARNTQIRPIEGYSIETTDKSDDKQICGNFRRTISLITTESESTDIIIDTNKKPTSINLRVTVTNISNEDQVEIRKNCSSFKVIDSSGNQINAVVDGCDAPTQNLFFLPKQQHNYQLSFDNEHDISPVRIEYTNMIESENDCKTFIDIKTSQP